MIKKIVMSALLMGLTMPLMANCGNNNGNGQGCSDVQGPAGQDGLNGTNGANGVDGKDGINGKDGKNGSDANVDKSAKLVLDTAVRLYDGKRIQLQAFNTYGVNRDKSKDVIGDGRNLMFGARIVFKLGSSYEERLLAAQDSKIKALEAALSRVQQ